MTNPPPTGPMVRPLHVLLVQEQESSAALVVAALRRTEFESTSERVETEQEFLDRISGDFDVIIADHYPPYFDAPRALRLLRERALDVPLVVVSARGGEEVAVECMKQGAVDYLHPDRLGRLGHALSRAISRPQAQRQARSGGALAAVAGGPVAVDETEPRFRRLAESVGDVIYRYDLVPRLSFSYVSPAVQRVLGHAPEALYADPELGSGLVHPEDRHVMSGAAPEEFMAHLSLRCLHRDGHVVWLDVQRVPVHDSAGNLVAVEGIARDTSERKALEERLAHQAFHDPLTGLPNRALFLEHVQQALAYAARHDCSVAVLFLDLDRFKILNDSLGHQVGDKLLVAVADRLRACIRSQDTVARLGGDEFTIVLPDVVDGFDAIRVAERVFTALQKPFSLDGREVYTTTSLGIALRPPSGGSADRSAQKGPAEDLVRDADVAMYRAKNRGRARYVVFDPSMHARALERLDLESELRLALERGEFRVYYQSHLLLETPGIMGMEALVRWEHPRRGLLAPAEFLAVAEESGLMVPIGNWLLREACRQARTWHNQYPCDPPLKVCVNLSARQFQHPRVVQDVAEVLRHTGLRPRTLVLEITESVAMVDGEAAMRTLQELKGLGVEFAIDHFGTGYSSLSYLKRFPLDYLKIDRSFVDGLGRDPEATAIVSAIVRLGHALGLKVTAQGVETAEQLGQLRSIGCDVAQGFYFARPLVSSGASAQVALLLELSGRTP